ncbi:hypothetical protein EAF04_004650 [Stromatinia cepivora]|nr:hypothetical protein EAF04_004650 [Stromatinia cepivora]
MNLDTMNQLLTSAPQCIDQAKAIYQSMKNAGIRPEFISSVLVVALVFALVALVFALLYLIIKSVVELFKLFFNFLQPLVVVGPLGLLILHYSQTSGLGPNQQFVLALMVFLPFGIITVWLTLKRTEERPTEMAKVQTNAAGVQTNMARVQKDVAGVQTDVAGVQTDAAGIQTDAAGVQTNAAGVQIDAARVQADAAGVQTNAAGVQIDAARVQADAAGVQTNMARVQ